MSKLTPPKKVKCSDPLLPQFVKDKIDELKSIGKSYQQITMMPGNVFEIKTATLCPPFESIVVQPEATGGKKTRKINRKDKNKKKHARKTKNIRKLKRQLR